STSYTLTADDVGSTIRARVTALATGGSQAIETLATDVVDSADQVTEPPVDYGQSYSDMVTGDNPWGYWRLEEAGSPAADSSANGNDLSYSAAGISAGASGRY